MKNFQRMNSWRAAAATLLVACGVTVTAGTPIVDQIPLSAGGSVPGNMLLVPSVEWPTVDSVANLGDDYKPATEYVGYFDPDKCYNYNYDTLEPNRYFYPVGSAISHGCSQTLKQWSGNFLNWAATQTIDPFRKALTGGYRTTDTNTVTILEKARSDGNTGSSIFPDRRLPQSSDDYAKVTAATPANWPHFQMRVRTLGNKLRFTADGDVSGSTIVDYNPNSMVLDDTDTAKKKAYEVSVRVKVCVAGMLEDNCVDYTGYASKPEGLIQKYAMRIRFSAFGYLNDGNANRDGGALRAQQKFVGPNKPDPPHGNAVLSNGTAAEWSATDGTFFQNPDSADATATAAVVGLPITNSGVINYINKFGEMTTKNHKSLDPVSELYYGALRYVRNKGHVSAYDDLTINSSSAQDRYEFADGFPVITSWNDPYQYWCQSTAIMGIGDVNTWNDKDLYGTTRTNSEPLTMPGEVASDTDVDVNVWTQKVATLEGITINTPFTGRENSAYIAGLAYWAHTQDVRPEPTMPKTQTVSTYWVDVREAQVLQPRDKNQYWLAAKYGGFTLPKGYNSLTNTTALDPEWWYTNGEDLASTPTTPATYPRADNFYVASDAEHMIDSMTRAFARIGSDRLGSGASLAANTTKLDTTTRTFQAQFKNLSYGQINSFTVDTVTGALSADPIWTVGTPIADGATATPGVALTRANADARNIYVNGSSYAPFLDANLTPTQKNQIKYTGLPGGTSKLATSSAEVVDWFRGKITREESETNGTLRTRIAPDNGWSPIMGDVVDSTPVFVGPPSPTLYAGATFTGASTYNAFANPTTGTAASRLGVLYVGGNDGMLHSFNAANGKEVYAFIPNASFNAGLGEFANPNYDHRYFVDGDMAIADVFDATATPAPGKWKTVLVGTMGRGGPGVFALDITDPQNVSFLWEKGTTQIPNLGRNIGKPVIAQVANGDWRVIFGNGPDSTNGKAELIQISVVATASKPLGSVYVMDADAGPGNALSAVLARDTDADGFADTAYAGDLKGNLWKFTGLSTTTATQSAGTSIFVAKDASNNVQKITAAPTAAKDPATGKTWIFFGTGEFLNANDVSDTTTRSTWYGIQDPGAATPPTRAELVQRTLTTVTLTQPPSPAPQLDFLTVRLASQATSGDMASKQGWYIDLPTAGERMVVPNRFQGGALIGDSRIPALVDVCQPTGSGWIMAIDPFSGSRLSQTFFDNNRDGVFDSGDQSGTDVISGINFGASANNPIFIENVMQVGLDDGTTRTLRTQGTNVDASRMSWREVLN